MSPKELEQTIRSLLKEPVSDAELRERLERLAESEISFSGFTWLFGPELYRRNRVLFRPFILSRFSTYMSLPKWKVERIHWKGSKAPILEGWLADADKNDDADLFRRLFEWRLNERFDWRKQKERSREISSEILTRFRSAGTPARRQTVLRKFDLWYTLDEGTACELYSVDSRASSPYILRRLPTGWLTGEAKRSLWSRLLQLADQRKDEDFRWKLYRRQVPLAEWTRECLALCDGASDSAVLVSELEKRHPEGGHINVADGLFQIVQRRGRDAFPYVMRHLRQVWGGWFGRGKYGQLADYARAREWWDLWSALVRVCSGANEFNKEVEALLDDTNLPETGLANRLLMLAGVSREWNWPGGGRAAGHQLKDSVALKFYERFPELLRGPYKLHIQGHIWGESYPRLLARFIQVEDEEMIDLLASRIVTRSGRWGNAEKSLIDADKLAEYYSGLKYDEATFSRRAANVLGQVPAFSIFQYNQLIRENRLARLLFERSIASYLADPRSVADLVEAAEIHVMALAYRALGLDDERARTQAVNHLPLLLATLLRPMQRATRLLAFGALSNAANTEESARLILDRARDALRLPDTKYPKEKLLGLIANIIHRWPQLRTEREQPVIYERAA
jgi:hypothetical protein